MRLHSPELHIALTAVTVAIWEEYKYVVNAIFGCSLSGPCNKQETD
jgi:hypothetical protein